MNYSRILEYARELRKNQTKAEKYFWRVVRNRKFQGYKFNRQFIIEHESHSFFIADFYCHEKKLIVEIDGDVHRAQVEYDKIREEILQDLGFRIIRFKNEEVLKNWSGVDEQLAKALANSYPTPFVRSEGSVELTPSPSLKKRGERISKKFRGEFENGALIKIVILGPESTGKSILSKKLAEHYQTSFVPEFARKYINEIDRTYDESDLLKIAKGQIQLEEEGISKSNQYLFYDTNLITIKIWGEVKYGRVDLWILESLKTRRYDFYLLMDIDLPWEPDPQREHPAQRQELYDLYKKHLNSNRLSYTVVTGKEERRLQSAIEAIESFTLSKT